MDPTTNYKEQIELATEIRAVWDGVNDDGNLTRGEVDAITDKAERLADLVLALNEWITKGGFLPAQWGRS